MLRSILIVCLGGAIGSLLRYATDVWLSKFVQSPFPYATFAVNILGCFLIGFSMPSLNATIGSIPNGDCFLLRAFVVVLLPFLPLHLRM